MLYVDSREAKSHPEFQDILSSLGVEVEVKPNLPADFVVPRDPPLLIERKTVYDLVSSIRSRRIFDQIRQGKEHGDYWIIMEGSLYPIAKYRRWAVGALSRLIESIVVDWQVPVIPSLDTRWTAEWLALKAKETPGIKREYPLRGGGYSRMSMDERRLYIMEGVGGRKIAENLLRAFGSIQAVANATIEDLEKVDLVGKKRAKTIYQLLRDPYQGRD